MVPAIWTFIATTSHLVAALASTALAAWFLNRRKGLGTAGAPIAIALALSASWAIAAASGGTDSAGAAMIESFRNVAWLFVVWCLFDGDGRASSVKPIRPLVIVLVCVELLQITMQVLLHRLLPAAIPQHSVFAAVVGLRLLFSIGTLMLVHNLYTGASQQARLALRWPASALALVWIFDLNLFTNAYLGTVWPAELAALRGVVWTGALLLLLPLTAKRRDELQLFPSRMIAFRFASLAGIGAYLLAMMVVTRGLDLIGGHYAKIFQFGVLIVASALAVLTLPSRRFRGWVKITLVKHLFRHRYDYRAEWLRFAQTIGRAGDTKVPLEVRAIQALAQITDSRAGILLTPGEHGDLELSGRWQWSTLDVPGCAMNIASIRFFERTGFIPELDAIRSGQCQRGEAAVVPAWVIAEPSAWVLVPLIHYSYLIGVVVLARPDHDRKLDWEDFDILRVVGQQIATTLSENANHDALTEAARFDEFHRRIAFVMHDIKNLASQFGLLAHNAELHADNPEFRADMLVTLRSSADKLNVLMARLSRYGAGGGEALCAFDIGAVVHSVVKHFGGNPQVGISECRGGVAVGNRETLEQALIHLVQNAVDASPPGSPVFIGQSSDGMHALIEIVDSGHGMSPDFIRSRLFKPFVSSKQGGFGIGAFESRELIRAMHGRLDVESREGLGTRFVARLPLSSTVELISTYEKNSQKVA